MNYETKSFKRKDHKDGTASFVKKGLIKSGGKPLYASPFPLIISKKLRDTFGDLIPIDLIVKIGDTDELLHRANARLAGLSSTQLIDVLSPMVERILLHETEDKLEKTKSWILRFLESQLNLVGITIAGMEFNTTG